MQVKIYFDDKPVYITDSLDEQLNELLHHPDVVFIDELSTPAINSLLHEIKKPDFHAGIIHSDDYEKLKHSFFKHFTVIEAAGGIVQNQEKDLLWIFRNGKWDLPKGKMEKKETAEICAAREIEEETGATKLTLKKKIGETYHVYHEYGKHILKISHWFFYTCGEQRKLKAQKEEGITEIKWFSTRDIKQPVSNTYATIKDILTVFFDAP